MPLAGLRRPTGGTPLSDKRAADVRSQARTLLAFTAFRTVS